MSVAPFPDVPCWPNPHALSRTIRRREVASLHQSPEGSLVHPDQAAHFLRVKHRVVIGQRISTGGLLVTVLIRRRLRMPSAGPRRQETVNVREQRLPERPMPLVVQRVQVLNGQLCHSAFVTGQGDKLVWCHARRYVNGIVLGVAVLALPVLNLPFGLPSRFVPCRTHCQLSPLSPVGSSMRCFGLSSQE